MSCPSAASGWLAKKISTHYIAVVHDSTGHDAFEASARFFEAPARPDRVDSDSDGTPRFIAEKLDQAAC